MGKLGDLFRKKIDVQEEQEKVQEQYTNRYNRVWLTGMTRKFDFDINEAGGKVDGILGALNRKEGHCPCGGNGDQFLCPCTIMREMGICKCGLFVTYRPINPNSTTTSAKIKKEVE